MIVEDETVTAMALKESLRDLGHEVVATVASGEDAVEEARRHHLDVILMDIRLRGEMDGVTAAETIRRETDVPSIYLTAYSDPETLARAKIAEPYGYLVKPYNERDLRAAIEIAVHNSALDRDRRRADAALRARESFLQQVVDKHPAPIYVKDAEGTMLFVNRAFERAFGVERPQVRGREDRDVLPSEVHARLSAGDARAVESGQSSQEELRLPIGGRERPFMTMRFPLTPAGGRGSLLGVVLVEAASEAPPPAQLEATLQALLASEPPAPQISRAPVDVSAMAREVLDDLRRGSPRRQVEANVEAGIVVQGDELLMRLVVENLLENAWKFTSRRREARIEVGRLLAGGFFVRDNGAGFDMSLADRLFVPFKRLHTPTEFPGAGLGLSSVKRIVERHGGRVWGEGEVDRGATFFVEL